MSYLLFYISSFILLIDITAISNAYYANMKASWNHILLSMLLFFLVVLLMFFAGVGISWFLSKNYDIPERVYLVFMFFLGLKILAASYKNSFIRYQVSDQIKMMLLQAVLASINVFIFGLISGMILKTHRAIPVIFIFILCIAFVAGWLLHEKSPWLYSSRTRLYSGILIMALCVLEIIRSYIY